MYQFAFLLLCVGISVSLVIVALAYAYRLIMDAKKGRNVVPVEVEEHHPLERRLLEMNERFAKPLVGQERPWPMHENRRTPARPVGLGQKREP